MSRRVDQSVVVYSHDGGREKAYDTAYTGGQARAATKACEARYPGASARVVDARRWKP